MAQFNRDRWQRVGATAEQLDTLEANFAGLDLGAQSREVARLAGVSDGDLRAELGASNWPIPAGEGDAQGGPGGSDPAAQPVDASPLPAETAQANDAVAGHDAS